MAQYKWKQIDKVLPAGGVALTGSLTISDTLTVPGQLIYSGSTLNTYINNQVYSSSNDWDNLSNKPAGLFSGSFVAGTNVTISQVGQTVTISTTAEPLPAGVVSGSQQVISLLPSGTVSGSQQVINLLPSGTVSGSSQISFLEVSNLPSGLVSSSAQILPIATGSITDFDLEVSRSAAFYGFSESEVATADIQDSVVTASLSGENLIMTKRDLSSFSVNLGSLSPDIATGSFFYSASFATAPDQLTFYNADGTLIVDLAGIAGSINDGDVTAVFAGDGLGGGGESGNLVLSVNASPSYGTNVQNDYITIATSSLYFKKGVSTALTEAGITGSLEISENLTVLGTITGSDVTIDDWGSISSSLASNKIYTTDTSASLASDLVSISSSLSSTIDTVSSSLAAETAQLLEFSSSLDDTFATDAELNTVSSSVKTFATDADTTLSSSLATDIASNLSDIEGNTTRIDSIEAVTGSYATTGSNLFIGDQDITGDLTVSGIVTAQEFHSEFVSASIVYESGSTKFGDTEDDRHDFTGSLGVSGSLTTTGNVTAEAFIGDGSQLTGLSADTIFTGSVSASVNLDGNIFTVQSGSDEFLVVSSSGRLSVDLTDTGSTGIHTNNINVGYPSSNNWQENLQGSYFNNFDEDTHVSEILRFMAGVLSSSLDVADAKPNTKYWDNVSTAHSLGSTTTKNALFNGVLGSSYESAKLSNNWSSSAFIDLSQTGSIDTVQEYLIDKGFLLNSETGSNQVGTNPFSNNYATRIPTTISTQATFGTLSFNVSANAGGTTDASSNANYFGLGALTNGGATGYSVRVISSQSFSDNYSDQTPDENSTFTTASVVDYSANSFGTTSDGLILSKIETSQPAVIPAAYQDGDFNNVDGPISGRKYTGGATSATSISASGYYKMHDIQVGIQTGSMSDFEYKAGSDSATRFYLYTGDIPTDITSGTKTVTLHDTEQNRTAFSATSRSLSGAPYLLTTTYTITFEGSVSGAFDPGYGYSTTPLQITNPTDTWENIGSTTLSNSTVTVNSNGVQTNSATRGVLSADKATQRSINNTPHIDDICFATASLSFTLDSNTDNVGQNRSSQETLNYNLSFRLTGRNWKNSTQTSTTGTTSLYDASLFGQASASGSMAVYSRAQGYDAGSLTGTTEQFSGEDYRIQITNDVLGFNGSAFTTDSFQTNDEGNSVLGDYDLQVKPGYLVDPGGDYGYWFASGFGSGTYKYYIRRFQTSGAKNSMTVNVGKTLVNWNSTSDGVAVALLFKSSASGSGANNELSQARIYDPSATTSNLIESNVSADNFKNPFTDDLDLYGNTGGSVASTTYTVPLRNVDGMYLDNSDNEFYLIIRYKGDPTPVTSITTSTS